MSEQNWVSFNDAAKRLNVRFQQVYQRAVVRGKMEWRQVGKQKQVTEKSIEEWEKVREAYFSK